MTLALVFTALAVSASSLPNPADNYYSWFSPEVADIVCDYAANEEYYEYLDYNGDGQLSISDAVSIARRYQENCDYGNQITIDAEVVNAIIEENYTIPCMYWEFDKVGDRVVRQYEVITDCIISADIYLEFEDFSSEHIVIEIDPFQETATVIDCHP